jgi:hypothetical protein
VRIPIQAGKRVMRNGIRVETVLISADHLTAWASIPGGTQLKLGPGSPPPPSAIFKLIPQSRRKHSDSRLQTPRKITNGTGRERYIP